MAGSPPRLLKGTPTPPDDRDQTLVERFAQGDASAFDQIVADHQGPVAALAYRLLGWSGEVEDVVQEVFLSALKGLPKFRRQARLSTWLTRITINRCRSHRRRHLLRLRWFDATRSTSGAGRSAAAKETLDRETIDRIHGAIRKLPMRYREVVVLRYLQEMSVEAISEALGTRPNTVQVRLHRARARLKESLAGLAEV